MMIVQGSNEPIIIQFNEDVSGLKHIEVALINTSSGMIIKHWSKTDMDFDGVLCICPLTQEDTIQMPAGECSIEVKWLDDDNITQFARIISDRIVYRSDKTIMGGA